MSSACGIPAEGLEKKGQPGQGRQEGKKGACTRGKARGAWGLTEHAFHRWKLGPLTVGAAVAPELSAKDSIDRLDHALRWKRLRFVMADATGHFLGLTDAASIWESHTSTAGSDVEWGATSIRAAGLR